jgi:hypothetical protein
MKLLQLQSEQSLTESVFSNNIGVGYSLPARCQIALKNLSMDFEVPTFNIIASGDDKNNEFSFATNPIGPIHLIQIPPDSYTFNELVRQINEVMNNALTSHDSDLSDYGFQWSVGLDINNTDGRLILSFNRADDITLNAGTVTNSGVTYNSGSAYFYKTVADDNGKFNAVFTGNTFVSNGGFIAKVTVDNQATPVGLAQSNWIFGVDAEKLTYFEDSKDSIVDLTFACISNSGDKYTFKKGGVLVQPVTPITITAGDTLSIYKKYGKIFYGVLRGTTLTEFEGDDIEELLPEIGSNNLGYIIHIGNDTGKIAFKNCIMTPTPFSTVSSGIYTITPPQDVKDVYLNTSLLTVSASRVTLLFDDKDTRELLGFLSTEYSKTAVQGSFKGDTSLSISILNNPLEVEIVELGNLNSYSQTTRQLKGTIGIIPKASLKSSVATSGLQSFELSYDETASWAFLSLDNDSPMRIPSLTVRATSNNKLVRLNGFMSICVLIQSESEGESQKN